jgi:hypothetical protein
MQQKTQNKTQKHKNTKTQKHKTQKHKTQYTILDYIYEHCWLLSHNAYKYS